MNGHQQPARCPRCGNGFECGASAGHCACFGLQLTPALRAELATRYAGHCLCLRCLHELGARPARPPVADADKA
ncbi:cysteine-rich CWC family protein [Pelomonas cellulosilytica]|uniref:Cysteine-rich CWC family protein n=1 Tax=Pelomonas cellulosilytica TaxID=2906762 RepID=A0ABS8XLJ3_9BURK|nr:cysteine-rich CWC family protein [Pelomonas sp. P8]MCE4553674.1 cysteine-rich CWC family protein [Pelomonas sp. P8]